MKIDVFTHFVPPKYRAALKKKVSRKPYMLSPLELTPAIHDMEARLQIIERFEDYAQVLTLAGPPLDAVVSPKDGAELAKMVNDEMAELQSRYPNRIVGAMAALPMHNMKAALKEAERAIAGLGLRGVQIHSSISGKPLDHEEFFPFYEIMNQFNLPILIHPMRRRETPDYPDEDHSRYWIWQVLGWPYESSVAMTRLVFSGVFDRYPDLKFVIHHCGAMVPFFSERIEGCYDYAEVFFKTKYLRRLRRPLMDYYRMFYGDTAIHGYTPGLMCGHDFFGADHILFATDMPHDSLGGNRYIRDTIAGVEGMDISESEKEMIFEDNARRLMRLPV
ncbi:MAG: amidohydrolase family protein [Desulfobacteraceae bacterium]|jgi:aminocarboxymuconate-semialdehyde decarboxylase